MQIDAKTFRPSATPASAVEYMSRHGLSAVPVTTGDGVFVGLVSLAAAEEASKAEG